MFDWIGDVLNAIRDFLESIYHAIEDRIRDVINSISDWFYRHLSAIQDWLRDMIDRISSWIVNVVQTLYNQLVVMISNLADWIASVINTIYVYIQELVNALRDVFETLVENIRSWLASVIDTIQQTIAALYDTIVSTVNNVINAVRDWFSATIENVRSWLHEQIDNVGAWINDTYERVSRWIREAIDTVADVYRFVEKTIQDAIAELNERISYLIEASRTTIDRIYGWLSETGLNSAQLVRRWLIGEDPGSAVQRLVSVFVEAAEDPDAPPWLRNITEISPLAGYMIFTVGSLIGAFFSLSSVLNDMAIANSTALQQKSFQRHPIKALSVEEAAAAVWRGQLSIDTFYDEASASGLDANRATAIIRNREALLSALDYIAIYRRGVITREQFVQEMRAHGFTDERIEMMLKASEFIPTPQDLIHLAIRDVFTPEVVEKYQLFSDIPSAYLEFCEKIGLSKDWAEKYWGAHWVLPSPTQGYEMLHRGLITRDDLALLLKTADYAPGWRQPLIDISYNPLTRVDVRRMHKLGVLNRDQVKRAYLDLGYTEENAEHLTIFTEKLNSEEAKVEKKPERDLTASNIETAYKRKAIDHATAMSMLIDIGYDDYEAEFKLAIIDFQQELELIDKKVALLKAKYLARQVDKAYVLSELGKMNLSATEIEVIMTEIEIAAVPKPKRPTLTDLRNFLKNKLMTLDEFVREVMDLGYTYENAVRYAKLPVK
jgi:predicted NBD/HSP70 family sugar kinase